MASNKSMQNKEPQPMFEAKTPHFFKVILESTLCQGKLGIPRKFVRKYGIDLSSSVNLKVPSGAVWQVEVIKCVDDIWFGKGWKEFVDYYSLAIGNMLVFEYDKNFGFYVLIFDLSCSEIDYPYSSMNDGVKEVNLENEIRKQKMEMAEEDNISVEILDEPYQSRKKKARPPIECTSTQKRIRTYNTRSNIGNGYYEYISGWNGKSNVAMGLTKSEKGDALKRASAAFKSDYPYFMVAMQPSYVFDGRLAIPARFVSKHFGKQCGNAILKTPDGRNWTVQFYNVGTSGRRSARITSGWKKFAQDNLLKVGDVCVFELLSGIEISLQVVCFRGVQDANHSLSLEKGGEKGTSSSKRMEPLTDDEGDESLKRASAAFNSKNPFFMVVMQPSYVHSCLSVYIPPSFAKKYLNEESGDVILSGLDGRTWLTKFCNVRGSTGAKIHCGWKAFAHDNCLEVGDVCVFEMIDSTAISFKVVIFKAAQVANCSAY